MSKRQQMTINAYCSDMRDSEKWESVTYPCGFEGRGQRREIQSALVYRCHAGMAHGSDVVIVRELTEREAQEVLGSEMAGDLLMPAE